MRSDRTRPTGERSAVAARAADAAGAARPDALVLALLGAQVVAFAAAAASGNIPEAVIVVFRALLTL